MTLRVLHVHSGNRYGGVETALATIARHQRDVTEAHHDFALCWSGRLSDELRQVGASVHELGAVRTRRPWLGAAARRRLGTVIATERPDVVVTHNPWAHHAFARTVRQSVAPLVLWAHGAPTNHWTERRVPREPPAMLLANSAFTAERWRAALPRVEVRAVHLPVETPSPSAGSERNAIRKELGCAAQTLVVIQVGRMEPGKGWLEHLQALAGLRIDAVSEAWFVGGAQTPEERRYVVKVDRAVRDLGLSGRVRLLGERQDVHALLAAADLYCQPNVAPEGFGITLVEALYNGLPVVTSDLGGAREIVTPQCGRLIAPHDDRAVTLALAELLSDEALRRRLSAGGPERAHALCDPVRQTRRIAETLAGVLRLPPRESHDR